MTAPSEPARPEPAAPDRASGVAAYRRVLGSPGGAWLSAFGLLGRAPMAMFPIGMLVLVVGATGSYSLAGIASAAFTLAGAVAGPMFGRIADRDGQFKVMSRILGVFLLAVAGLVIVGATDGPEWAYPLLAAVAGAFLPQVGGLVRVRWAHRLADADDRTTAQALESVNDELSFLVGPAIVALIAARTASWVPVALAGALAIVGISGVLLQRASEPPPAGRRAASPDGGQLRARLRVPHVPFVQLVFVVTLLGIGAVLGANTVLMVAYAEPLGGGGLTALVFTLNSLSSLVAGAIVGGLRFASSPHRRFTIATLAFGASVIPLALVDGAAPFVLAATLSGLLIAPTFIQGNAHVAESTPPDRRTEAFAWTASAVLVGISLGSSFAGSTVDALGPDDGRLGMLGLAAVTVVVALAGEWAGRRRPVPARTA